MNIDQSTGGVRNTGYETTTGFGLTTDYSYQLFFKTPDITASTANSYIFASLNELSSTGLSLELANGTVNLLNGTDITTRVTGFTYAVNQTIEVTVVNYNGQVSLYSGLNSTPAVSTTALNGTLDAWPWESATSRRRIGGQRDIRRAEHQDIQPYHGLLGFRAGIQRDPVGCPRAFQHRPYDAGRSRDGRLAMEAAAAPQGSIALTLSGFMNIEKVFAVSKRVRKFCLMGRDWSKCRRPQPEHLRANHLQYRPGQPTPISSHEPYLFDGVLNPSLIVFLTSNSTASHIGTTMENQVWQDPEAGLLPTRRKGARMSANQEIARRLRQVRIERFGESGENKFAQFLGVSQRTWLNYESGVIVPGAFILHFLELTSVEPIWLLRGEGLPYKRDQIPNRR